MYSTSTDLHACNFFPQGANPNMNPAGTTHPNPLPTDYRRSSLLVFSLEPADDGATVYSRMLRFDGTEDPATGGAGPGINED